MSDVINRAAEMIAALARLENSLRLAAAERDVLRNEVARLREVIQYAIDGRDADLPEALGGRAVDGCKKILRAGLGGKPQL